MLRYCDFRSGEGSAGASPRRMDVSPLGLHDAGAHRDGANATTLRWISINGGLRSVATAVHSTVAQVSAAMTEHRPPIYSHAIP